MKTAGIAIGFLCVIYGYLFSQGNSKPDVQIPGSPGLSVIGVQNVEMVKPGNYTGLYTNLISPILSNNGTVPADLSMEFSPFYLESRDITLNELYKTNIYRDLRISIASTKVTTTDSVEFSRMGIGFRTNIIGGDFPALPKNTKLSLANDVNTTLMKINSGVYGLIDTAGIHNFVNHIEDKETRRTIERIILSNRKNIDVVLKELSDLRGKIEELIEVDYAAWDLSMRTGHFIEIAGAFAIDFPANTFTNIQVRRWGLWLNYTFRPVTKTGIFDFGAILRISNYSFQPAVVFDDTSLFGDVGVSMNVRIPKTRILFSGEMVGKFGFSDFKATENQNQYTFTRVSESKWNLSLGYQITENVLWSVSLSEIAGNQDYIRENAIQFLVGVSAALAPLNK